MPLLVVRAKSCAEVKRADTGSTRGFFTELYLVIKSKRTLTLRRVSGPLHGELKELRVLRELPCVRGSHASWRDGGCLAGRCALS